MFSSVYQETVEILFKQIYSIDMTFRRRNAGVVSHDGLLYVVGKFSFQKALPSRYDVI